MLLREEYLRAGREVLALQLMLLKIQRKTAALQPAQANTTIFHFLSPCAPNARRRRPAFLSFSSFSLFASFSRRRWRQEETRPPAAAASTHQPENRSEGKILSLALPSPFFLLPSAPPSSSAPLRPPGSSSPSAGASEPERGNRLCPGDSVRSAERGGPDSAPGRSNTPATGYWIPSSPPLSHAPRWWRLPKHQSKGSEPGGSRQVLQAVLVLEAEHDPGCRELGCRGSDADVFIS
ncbi:arginine-glutamic acid dipeptide repeats protein-like [Numida meleagris]|uniref:arginine-glutamic acid dipeptide repeats protein-like n=1 Tax=Numida meleagris TaxID=8996 RepID=UPI000B3D97EC|nr:arginine-glutamic acid dipeptide repeats protein-like [Numida meleagris]